jgi:hypothetical protein
MPSTPLRSCGRKDEHEYHGFHEITRLHCSGQTDCGVEAHEPHFFERNVGYWCRGICKCGDKMRGPHGPGDHK